MARPRETKMLSVMSSIKCAGCGKAIDIMTLADHVCGASSDPVPAAAPAAPTLMTKLFGGGDTTAAPTKPDPTAVAEEKPAVGGFFGWRKAAAPPTIDTSNANRSYDATPELSDSDYSDDEGRSASPRTPSTQITSPGSSTWSRGMSKERSRSNDRSQSSPSSDKPLPDEDLQETTTRLGGLFGAGGFFKRLNNTGAGPFATAGTDSKNKLDGSLRSNADSSPDGKPRFRNAAGRDQLKMSNRPPSLMQEVYGSKAPAPKSRNLFTDISDSNPFAASSTSTSTSRGRSNTAVDRPTQPSQREAAVSKSASARNPQKPLKFDYLKTAPSNNSSGTRRKLSDDRFKNFQQTETDKLAARMAERLRNPSFKTERPPVMASNSSFGATTSSSSQARGNRPKMFPEATPLGGASAAPAPAPPAPRNRGPPPVVNRYARNEFDMYSNSMASTPSSVNSSPERLPFNHGRKLSNTSSALSSNASSVSSGGTPKHMCRGCMQPIMGRSLRDSSGRLSGRYHHDCFRCACCTAPFPSGEFYVLDNIPLCKRDYHERNGTQCSKCRGGIEGRYVETDKKEMFHDGCFCCAECDINLGEEYWEVGGRRMCQKHAMAASKMESMMKPADVPPPVPQKRQTRFGMMGALLGADSGRAQAALPPVPVAVGGRI